MRKILVMLACMLAIGTMSAQEKKGGFSFEGGVGTACFGNYSPVSVFADGTDRYSLVGLSHASFGYYGKSGWFMGLSLDGASGSTAFNGFNESFDHITAMYDIRCIRKVSSKLELEAGVAIGLLVQNNSFDYAGNLYSFSRLGVSGQCQLQLNYLFTENLYMGFRIAYPCVGALMGDKPSLPAGLMPNEKTQFSGYNMSVNFGFRF